MHIRPTWGEPIMQPSDDPGKRFGLLPPRNLKFSPRLRIGLLLFVLFVPLLHWAELNPDKMEAFARERYGASLAQSVKDWRKMVAFEPATKELDRVRQVNAYFNKKIVFRSDQDLYKQDDYWATLLETLNNGAGDCEDYVIAKYVSLLASGVPNSRLRLTYVRLQRLFLAPEPHMVLAYYPEPEADPLILDNLDPELKLASVRSDLTPVYSFNSSQLWVQGRGPSNSDPSARISRWRDVLERLRLEFSI
jgi:predicted transglutaminase-like cysteine proteinase